MTEPIAASPSKFSLRPSPPAGPKCKRVRGWLLAVCLMLTIVGPIISAWLIADEYGNAAPLFAKPLGTQLSVLASIGLSVCSVAFGVYAGLRLWLIRPNAVTTAKRALLFGLAVDVVTTTIQAASARDPDHGLLYQVEVSLIPSLIFFTLCFAYLNRSARVEATYGPCQADA